ncbi:MAG: S-adenosylmethionine decarboxylase [Deinococcus sp.]|nr:S-adenosylmethionine decarboxylase [Deinococcus sp.]
MQHFMIDGFQGFRSRFDHIQLIQEVLEEVPVQLGLRPAMPAFLLPYYNGVVPEDCGVSSFLFLVGGHFTLHTFSFREAYFADLVTPTVFDTRRLRQLLDTAFPCATTTVNMVERAPGSLRSATPNVDTDFGPHLFLDIEDYQGPRNMDGLFALFDRLPSEIGMTPIMRPYILRGTTSAGQPVLSAMTMIAESHISLHVFEGEGKAYFDLFSCRFFDRGKVVPRIQTELPGRYVNEALIARGSKYRFLRTERSEELARSKSWLEAVRR